ncbi:MAG: G5 domain-containing protein [Clostridia bacterium]
MEPQIGGANNALRGKFKFLLMVLIALLILSGISAAAVYYIDSISYAVTLRDDGREVEIVTLEKTVGEFLEKYEIELGPGDSINLDRDDRLYDGVVIEITRTLPFYVVADQEEKTVYLPQGATVADVLKKAGIALREKDVVNYRLDAGAIPGEKVIVTRYDEEVIIEKEPIAYNVIIKKDDNMDEGEQKVVQEGREGELQRKILVTYRDGQEISRKVIEEKVAVQPIDRVVHVGTVKKKITSRGDVLRYSTVKTFVATAYTHTGNPTKTGVMPKVGYIAVDPRIIPLYKTVYIEFPKGWEHLNGYYKAMDIGGAIKGYRIDVFMDSESECIKFGRRSVKVYFPK